MVRTLISYTVAAGIMTPPAILSTQTSPEPDPNAIVPQYPLLRTTQLVHPYNNTPIPHNSPTVVPPPAPPTSEIVTPQFVVHHPEAVPAPPPLKSLPTPEPTVAVPKPSITAPVVVLPPPPEMAAPPISGKPDSPETVTHAAPVFLASSPDTVTVMEADLLPLPNITEPSTPQPLDVPVTVSPIEPVFSDHRPEAIPIAVIPPPPTVEPLDEEISTDTSPPADLTVLREVATDAHITGSAPVSAHDMMSGEPLWETTEAISVEADNHQVLLEDQAHTELILTVPEDEHITVNGTDYPGGLVVRAQDDELYVVNYLSEDNMDTVPPDITPTDEAAHLWYDLDGRLPEPPPQLAQRESP